MKRIRVPVRVIPSFAIVQALRETERMKLTESQRRAMQAEDVVKQQGALRKLSERFAAAMRKRGWLAEEGYAK